MNTENEEGIPVFPLENTGLPEKLPEDKAAREAEYDKLETKMARRAEVARVLNLVAEVDWRNQDQERSPESLIELYENTKKDTTAEEALFQIHFRKEQIEKEISLKEDWLSKNPPAPGSLEGKNLEAQLTQARKEIRNFDVLEKYLS